MNELAMNLRTLWNHQQTGARMFSCGCDEQDRFNNSGQPSRESARCPDWRERPTRGLGSEAKFGVLQVFAQSPQNFCRGERHQFHRLARDDMTVGQELIRRLPSLL